MEDADREVREFIGDEGKTAEQVADRFPAFDVEGLVRAELTRPRRTTQSRALRRPGNRLTQPCGFERGERVETPMVASDRERPSSRVATIGMASQARCRGFESHRPL
jgi:hypothetical protein